MRVALVHDWLDTYRGGEKVLEAIAEMFPQAPIYTLFYSPEALPPSITSRDIRYPKHLQWLRRFRKLLLPILPRIIESFDLSEFDLVISTSSCVAKGVIVSPWTHHICYLHSPMRYAWDQRFEYERGLRIIPGARAFFRYVCHQLRIWDYASAARVDQFLVNSSFVGRRVALYYGRDAQVLPPAIEVNKYLRASEALGPRQRDFFLVAGAWVPYKRVELAIEACERLKVKLVVAGAGPMASKLAAKAGPHTSLVHAPSDEELMKLMHHAKALLFPGVEDFGLIPIETMAMGTPVIAYARGGALDYVVHGENGVLFSEQTTLGLERGINEFLSQNFTSGKVAASVSRFDKKHFHAGIQKAIEQKKGLGLHV